MADEPTRIIVFGANGRMGRLVAAAAERDPGAVVVALADRREIREIQAENRDVRDASPARPPVVVDFSSDEGTRAAATLALERGAALLVGTTGLSAATGRALAEAAKKIPVLACANTSPGVAALRRLLAEAARLLGPGFDVELVESHHRRKLDAPSGTALALAETLAGAGVRLGPERIHSLRGGDIVGRHEVVFAGPGETIRISHEAESRELFALGAIRAARWLAGRPAGTYRIEDTL